MQQFLASYLLNAVWQVPVVALCALLVSRFADLSPGARNRFWLVFLGVAAVLPAVSLGALLPQADPTVARLAPGAPLDGPTAPITHIVPAAEPALRLTAGSVEIMIVVFAIVAVALAIRLLAAAAATRRLVRQSEPAELPGEALEAIETLARAHDRQPPPVRRSAGVSSPAVVGVLRPTILIPKDMATGAEDLRAALLHETAHVIRHDYAVNLVCEVLTLPLCWHPALFGLKAGVSRSRELACDAIAAAAMASPKAYARCLVSLAQALGASNSTHMAAPGAALAVGLFGRSELEDRLMQLMKPRDAEAPAVRAARFCGLAAVGASLLGSAALLHVTPVFAQSTSAPVAVQPLAAPPAAAAAAVNQAQTDAAKPAAKAHHGIVLSKKGIILSSGEGRYAHTFTGADGAPLIVYSDDPKDLSPDEQRQWEQTARDAEAKAAEALKKVNSPEFKARIAEAEAHGAEVEKMVNSPEFKARIARANARAAEAEKMINSPEFKDKIAKAAAKAADDEKMIISPEFKDKIAKAAARAAEAEAMVNSPEFKARIERAQARAAEAEKRINSPEFQERIARLQRQLDELSKQDAPAASTATP